jgi:hypothetical protein
MSVNNVPILIYVPGLGRAEANSADRLAEVIANAANVLDDTMIIGTKSPEDVPTPHGLTVGKTVVGKATDNRSNEQTKLQLFQFDYASALEVPRSKVLPSVAPGMIRSAAYAVWASFRWIKAVRQPAKEPRTKAQLLLGLVGALALIFLALMALYLLLVALGVDLEWFGGIFGAEAAPWTFGAVSLGITVTWARLRAVILALAETAQRLIRFVRNVGGTADNISVRLDTAIDALRDSGWKGPLHLLGYSFGSLVLFEAMYPRETSQLSEKPLQAVSSLVTVGCPLDLVRLYDPSYVEVERVERKPDLVWVNVFNKADICASNLKDGDDESGGPAVSKIGAGGSTSMRYLDEEMSAFQIFMNEKTHSGYWGLPEDTHCFWKLVPSWLAVP